MKTPEQLAVEWLKEEYGDTSNWTYMGQEMSLDAFYAGYQAAKPQWISVKERLPEAEQRVVIFDRGQFSVSYLTAWGHWAIEQQDVMKEPTYWMPLPKPPEDAKE
jgi:hypothetical protein